MTHHRFIYYSLQYPEFLDILKSAANCDFVLDTYYELCRFSITAISKTPVKIDRILPKTRTPEIKINGLNEEDNQPKSQKVKSKISKTNQSAVNDSSNQSEEETEHGSETEPDENKDAKVTVNQNLDQIPEEKEPEEGDLCEPENDVAKKQWKSPRIAKGKQIRAFKTVAWRNHVRDNNSRIKKKESSNITIRERSQNNLKAPRVKRTEGMKSENNISNTVTSKTNRSINSIIAYNRTPKTDFQRLIPQSTVRFLKNVSYKIFLEILLA